MSIREVVLAGLLLGLLAAATYVWHVRDGGWYYDDWAWVAALELDAGVPGASALEAARTEVYRPGLALLMTMLHALGGRGQAPYLLIGVGLVALEALLAYVVLRLACVARIAAFPVAAMLTVVPAIDSTRLWITGFQGTAAIVLMLGGFATALLGTRLSGARAVTAHAAALALYAGSILTYELVAVPILSAVFLYRVRLTWPAALHRWVADLVVVSLSVASLLEGARQWRAPRTELNFMLERARQIASSAIDVLGSLLPLESFLLGPAGLAVAALGFAGCVMALVRGDRLAGALRRWGMLAVGGLAFAAAGFVMLLPADPYFIPRVEGIGNRTSVVAVLGAMLFLVAVVWLLALGVAHLLRRPALAPLLAAAALAITTIGMFETELSQQEAWASSWQQSQDVVNAIRVSVGPEVPPDSGIVTFRHANVVPGDVPVFAAEWDLRGAVRLLYDDWTVKGYPWLGDGKCTARGLELGPGRSPYDVLRYRVLWFVDATAFRARRIDTVRACRDALGELTGIRS